MTAQSTGKSRSRRQEIRKNRPDTPRLDWQALKDNGVLASLGIAAAFCVAAAGILMLRQDVARYRPDQWIPHDVVSRVAFSYPNADLREQKEREAREREPRVYRANGDVWAELERELLALPRRVAGVRPDRLPADLAAVVGENAGALAAIQQTLREPEQLLEYEEWVRAFVTRLRAKRVADGDRQVPLIVLPPEQRAEDIDARRVVYVPGQGTVDPFLTKSAGEGLNDLLEQEVRDSALLLTVKPLVVAFTAANLRPTHVLDEMATTEARNRAAALVPESEAVVHYPANSILVPKRKGVFTTDDWHLLRAENRAYLKTVKGWALKTRLGLAAIMVIMTAMFCGYVAHYQPRIVRNHARAAALAALLLSMLLLAQVAAIGSGPLYLFGLAPTLLVAMTLTIGYDQRFAIGMASMHGLLVTLALDQTAAFFVIQWVGVLTVCYLMDDIRTRSKLIEVGGLAALAMIAATVAASALSLDPMKFIVKNCLYAGLAGLAVGFIALGILPFLEKAFRITTSMTLLELADASQPLLRRLQMEAPGTYNHSIQVATLAESAAEAIGLNSLLARVGAYYHDVGKINKPEYFIENCMVGAGAAPGAPGAAAANLAAPNRHLNLSPNVSFLIIVGHVKDGVELAKEYNLPNNLITFIQQHHGTTLVEYFYHQACTQKDQRYPDQPAVSDTQYRYPGPKPRTKEVAIVMMADCVESAARSMTEPTPARVESLVHDLLMKRLLDGQFDDCDLTMRELEQVERSLVKTLLGIYHTRVAYPSSSSSTTAANAVTGAAPVVRSA